jgi:hypothetical protein
MRLRSVAVMVGAAVAMSVFADTADAARKRHKRSVQPPPHSYVGPPKTYRQAPARMIEIAPGKWISSWGCYTDEGYGRYGSCDMKEGPM